MDARAHISVSLPRSDPTVPYWQDPPSSIAHHRTTPDLPSTADYVIIGSGISGACIALNLLERKPDAKVVMLEARTACSGATGRNGGHTKSATYRHFPHEHAALGLIDAIRIAKLEYSNMQAVHALAKRLNIPCDAYRSCTVDIIYDVDQFTSTKKTVSFMNDNIDGGVERYRIVEQDEARKEFLCPNAVGAIEYDAGSVHSYNFCVGVVKHCLHLGLNLQTTTPVTSLAKDKSTPFHWTATTHRGPIKTPAIILATNAYTSHIVPLMQGLIVPLRGQVTSQRPGSALPKPLSHTYTFSYANGYEYMIPRPPGSLHVGDIIIGGGWANLPDEGATEFGETNDAVLHPAVSTYLYDCTARYFGSNWGADATEGRIRKEWTGIMGATADGMPFVGSVPGMDGVWMSAGFNGHGMVLCLKCAEGLVDEICGEQGSGEGNWFPRGFRLTEERVTRLKKEGFHGRRNDAAPPAVLEERSVVEG